MPTKVFISWSGDLSKRFAEALRTWLPSVLQHVEPYFSPDDIEKGTKWDKEISQKLEETQVGIICLTRENIERPWILFEAGALSKNIEQSNVCPILLDLGKTDITGPLTRFQATELNQKDFKRLVRTINKASKDSPLDPGILDNVFDKWWPDLSRRVEEIRSRSSKDLTDGGPFRNDRELLEEVLELVRAGNMSRINDFRQNEQGAESLRQIVQTLHRLWSLFEGVHEEEIRGDFNSLKEPIRVLAGMVGRDDLYIYFKGVLNQLTLKEVKELVKEAGPAHIPKGAIALATEKD